MVNRQGVMDVRPEFSFGCGYKISGRGSQSGAGLLGFYCQLFSEFCCEVVNVLRTGRLSSLFPKYSCAYALQ